MSAIKPPKIIIVGGGAGGLGLATSLGKKLGKKGKALITLVDQSATHIWKPLLHEVASGTVNSSLMELNYFIHASKNGYDFQLGQMIGLDRTKKVVKLEKLKNSEQQELLPARELCYDILIIAIGSTCNDFSTPGAVEHCIFLDSRNKAEYLHKQFLDRFVVAHAQTSTQERNFLAITIIGGGATGVELAAELTYAARAYSQFGLDELDDNKIQITLIEAADRLLVALPESIAIDAKVQLEKLGVNVLLKTKVVDVTAEAVTTDQGSIIQSSLKVWCAGIKAPAFLASLDGLESNKINQLLVESTLQTTQDHNIFVIGDCGFCKLGDNVVPPTAQAAHQQATFLLGNILRKLNKQELRPFIYHNRGSLVSLSDRQTLGVVLNKVHVHGLLAKIMYKMLYQMHLVQIHGMFKTIALVWSDIFRGGLGPRIKLH